MTETSGANIRTPQNDPATNNTAGLRPHPQGVVGRCCEGCR
jgi:hypothetical protein